MTCKKLSDTINSSTGNKQFLMRWDNTILIDREQTIPAEEVWQRTDFGEQGISCRVQAHTAAPPIMGIILKRKRVNRAHPKK